MKLLILSLILKTIQVMADDEGPPVLKSIVDSNLIRSPSSLGQPLDPCPEAHLEEESIAVPPRVRQKGFRFIYEFATNRTEAPGTSAIDCPSILSPVQAQADGIIKSMVDSPEIDTMAYYQSVVKSRTKGWSDLQKLCFTSTHANNFSDYYAENMPRDGIGNRIGSDEVINNYRAGENGAADASTGVCIQIHKAAADIASSMGIRCGTTVVQQDAPDNDAGGIRLRDVNTRFMHAVNICKNPSSGKYFIINYDRIHEIDARTYQEAIDQAGLVTGSGNFAGNQMTCISDTGYNIANCNHAYLPRDSRWILATIDTAVASLREGNFIRSNNRGDLSASFSLSSSSSTRESKDGFIRDEDVTHGAILTGSMYKGQRNMFLSTGYGRITDERYTREGERTPTSITQSHMYAGAYLYDTPMYLPYDDPVENTHNHAGLIFRSKSDYERFFTERLSLRMDIEHVIGIGMATAYRPGAVFDLGYTNLGKAEINYKTSMGDFSLGQTGSLLTGNQNNLPIPYLGQSTLGHHISYRNPNEDLSIRSTSRYHLMYGDTTSALDNNTEFQMRLMENISIRGSYHIGWTGESDDLFYDAGIWQEGRVNIGYVSDDGEIEITGYVEGSTGQMPAQFGEGLKIEDNPLPERTIPGFGGGIQLKISTQEDDI